MLQNDASSCKLESNFIRVGKAISIPNHTVVLRKELGLEKKSSMSFIDLRESFSGTKCNVHSLRPVHGGINSQVAM